MLFVLVHVCCNVINVREAVEEKLMALNPEWESQGKTQRHIQEIFPAQCNDPVKQIRLTGIKSTSSLFYFILF